MGRKSLYFGDKDYLIAFGKRFRRLRKEYLGLTQAAMAVKLNVKPSRISQIESGTYPAGLILLNSVCRTFNVDPRWLLGLKTKKKK